MTLREWLMSSADNPDIGGQWRILHIGVLLLCITTIILFAIFVRNKSLNTRNIIITILISCILFWEISQRIIELIKCNPETITFNKFLSIILPRPWCAMSCWLLISTFFIKKDWFYNLCSTSALISAIIFFTYPGVGFNALHVDFSNLYSIVTHALLLVTSITLITFRFTNFTMYNLKKVLIGFAGMFVYALLQIFVLKIEPDPMYFMPSSDILEILGGFPYAIYIIIYIVLLSTYILSFFYFEDKKAFIRSFNNLKNKIFKKHNTPQVEESSKTTNKQKEQ